jgi:hypothetical protein
MGSGSRLDPMLRAIERLATPDAVAAASVGLAAVALTCGTLGVLLWGAVVLGAIAACSSAALAVFCRRLGAAAAPSETAGLLPRCFVGGAVAGFLNTVLSYVVLAAGQGRLPFGHPFVQVPLVASAALVVGMPLGMLFGTLYVIPLRAVEQRAHVVQAAALRRCGAWLASVGGASLGLGLFEVWLWHNGHLERGWPLALGCAPAILGGVAARALGSRGAAVAPCRDSVAM